MALIYASAVNKRMNSHSVHRSRKKSSTTNAPDFGQMSSSHYHIRQRSNEEKGQCDVSDVYRSLSSTREKTPLRIRSTSQHSSCQSESPRHKMSLDLQSHRYHGAEGSKSTKSHKPIQRSRTSCGDLVQKNEKTSRKISSPVMTMTQSMTFDEQKKLSKSDLRRSIAQRRLIQEYGLEPSDLNAHSSQHEADNGDVAGMSRRKSVSLDPEDWKHQIDAAVEAQTGVRHEICKPSAFQRMRMKFAKLKLSKSSEVR